MAHTYNTKTNSTRSNGNPKTFNHTCGAGTTLLVLTLVIGGGTARETGAPTYNGVAMTQADAARQAASSPETTVEMWYLLDPPTGSAYQVSIPNSGTVYITAEVASFKAATSNKTALREANYSTGTSTNPTGPTHSPVAGDVIIAVLGYGDDSSNATAGGTSLYAVDDGTYMDSAQYTIYAGGNASLNWTDATSEDWVIVSAVFKEVSNLGAGQVGVSKTVAYAVLSAPAGVDISKAVAYAVLSTETTISISKAVVYAVLEPLTDESGPMLWVF